QTSPPAFSFGVAARLTANAAFRPGHHLHASLADLFFALPAVAEVFWGALQANERLSDLCEPGRPLRVALGGDDLVHLVERLRILVRSALRRVVTVWIDPQVAVFE